MKRGKQLDGHLHDELVSASADLIKERWRPDPAPRWVTCVPSLRHQILLPHFAERLALAIDLPFVPCVRKTRETAPQKAMMNEHQQARNLNGAFAVDAAQAMPGPVLLVDDIVDSGWTLTVIAALLRLAGSGPVYPYALALITTK